MRYDDYIYNNQLKIYSVRNFFNKNVFDAWRIRDVLLNHVYDLKIPEEKASSFIERPRAVIPEDEEYEYYFIFSSLAVKDMFYYIHDVNPSVDEEDIMKDVIKRCLCIPYFDGAWDFLSENEISILKDEVIDYKTLRNVYYALAKEFPQESHIQKEPKKEYISFQDVIEEGFGLSLTEMERFNDSKKEELVIDYKKFDIPKFLPDIKLTEEHPVKV
jgi:hypothetical protein